MRASSRASCDGPLIRATTLRPGPPALVGQACMLESALRWRSRHSESQFRAALGCEPRETSCVVLQPTYSSADKQKQA